MIAPKRILLGATSEGLVSLRNGAGSFALIASDIRDRLYGRGRRKVMTAASPRTLKRTAGSETPRPVVV
jgi:hypothetical protein